jgi:copper chaperone CopZ
VIELSCVKMGIVKLAMQGVSCQGCADKVSKILKVVLIPGVEHVTYDHQSATATVSCDEDTVTRELVPFAFLFVEQFDHSCC